MSRLLLVPLLVVVFPSSTLAQATPTPTEPVAVVREYVAAQNRGDVETMLALVANQVEIRVGLTNATLTSATTENHSQLRARFTRISQGFPGARTEILELITDGSVVITKERMSGLPTGLPDTGLAMYRVRGGKIESLWAVSSAASSGDQ